MPQTIERRCIYFLDRHLWWIAPIVIVMPLVYISGSNPAAPSAAYFGTTGIWNLVEKVLDRV